VQPVRAGCALWTTTIQINFVPILLAIIATEALPKYWVTRYDSRCCHGHSIGCTCEETATTSTVTVDQAWSASATGEPKQAAYRAAAIDRRFHIALHVVIT
jgi:hypothetical protein